MGDLGDRAQVVVVVSDGERDVSITLGHRRADLSLVDELARLRLAVGRFGYTLRFASPCSTVQDLLTLVGLADLFPPENGSAVEARGKPEGDEQIRTEEVVQPGDPCAGDLDHLQGEGFERT